ncbi:MAG: hypothetical protein HC821_04780 [Lewinella sp.]|nr:hypothetical protein [Lewinella sp.]
MRFCNLTLVSLLAFPLVAQRPILLSEQAFTLSSGDEAVYYFGFRAGDELLLTASLPPGQDGATELSIVEYPGVPRFRALGQDRTFKESLKVTKTAVYQLRFLTAVVLAARAAFA